MYFKNVHSIFSSCSLKQITVFLVVLEHHVEEALQIAQGRLELGLFLDSTQQLLLDEVEFIGLAAHFFL